VRTILSTLSDAKAHKELKQYTLYAVPSVAVGYFILSWLGALGVFFGLRAFLLTFHAGNKSRRYLWPYRIFTAFIVLVGAYELLFFWTHI
jgi:hypothetical protein